MKVVKIGGAQVDTPVMSHVWAFIRKAHQEGEEMVVVHGGGSQTTKIAQQLGHTSEIIQGRRVTTDLDLKIIQWVIRGELNARLSAQAVVAGVRAVGISGIDDGLVEVIKRPLWNVDGRSVDFGWVGDVQKVNPELLFALINAGFIPVVATMGVDKNGQIYNVNGDTVSLEIAKTVGATEIVMVTESGGLRKDLNDPSTHCSVCDTALLETGRQAGWIQGGMLVKLEEAQKALRAGIKSVLLIKAEDLAHPEKGTKVTV